MPITINSFWCCPTQSRRPFHEKFLKVKKNLEEQNIQVIENWDHLLVEPLKVFSGNNKPYSVYGPFYKNIKSKMNLLGPYEQDKVVFQFKDIDNKLKDKIINSSDSVLEKFIKNIKFKK